MHTGKPKQSPQADRGSGKCWFTLGSFSALHQAQEAFRSLCFISTPSILTFSFLNEKGFREVGGTGKEICSLLLLCELSRGKRHWGLGWLVVIYCFVPLPRHFTRLRAPIPAISLGEHSTGSSSPAGKHMKSWVANVQTTLPQWTVHLDIA